MVFVLTERTCARAQLGGGRLRVGPLREGGGREGGEGGGAERGEGGGREGGEGGGSEGERTGMNCPPCGRAKSNGKSRLSGTKCTGQALEGHVTGESCDSDGEVRYSDGVCRVLYA
eukprot:3867704-Rhodomonas_salina.1